MSRQTRDSVEQVSPNTVRFYLPADLVADSTFPFSGGDPFVVRTIPHEAVVMTPPESDLSTIDLPPIEAALRTQTHATR